LPYCDFQSCIKKGKNMQKQGLASSRRGGGWVRVLGVAGVGLFLFGCATFQQAGVSKKPQKQEPLAQSHPVPAASTVSVATVTITLPELSVEERKKAAAIMKPMEASAGFREGKGSPHETLYIFVDPSSAICHKLFHLMRSYVAEGVSVKWIPVSVLKGEKGVPFAAAILQSEKQQEIASILGGQTRAAPTMTESQVRHGKRQARATPDGSTTSSISGSQQARTRARPTTKTAKSLNNNLRVFHGLGGRTVPLIAYYSPRRGKACGYAGIPNGKRFESMLNHKCPSE
jgi:hypothetical protein